jgi:hypothetical protein
MLTLVRGLATAVAIVEVWSFGRSATVPSNSMEIFWVLGVSAWVLSPLVALALVAGTRLTTRAAKLAVFVGAVAVAGTASWFILAPIISPASQSPEGMEAFVLPALQWLFVFAMLLALRAFARGARTEAARA